MKNPFQRAKMSASSGVSLCCVGLCTAILFQQPASAAKASPLNGTAVETQAMGTLPDGTRVESYTLRNRRDAVVQLMTYGATILEIRMPDREGRFANVLLGSDSLDAYLSGFPAASVIGRFANRIANARFELDGQTHTLAANNGPNHIHGGRVGFARKVWKAEIVEEASDGSAVRFSYLSPDGEEGYPGNLKVSVLYRLTDANELIVEYSATTDAPTVLNLTNHAYFNLAGSGDVLDHRLWLACTHYTPAGPDLIPTGNLASVTGTVLDFTSPTRIGDRIEQLKPRPGGYDHNFVVPRSGDNPTLFARLSEPRSGRVMDVLTTEPGFQLYSGNHLRDITGTDGKKFGPHGGICLETQHYPDSPNQPQFPSVTLRPDKSFHSQTIFRFRTIP